MGWEIIGPDNVKKFGATKGIALKDFQTNLLKITKDISNIYCFDSSISKLKESYLITKMIFCL